MAIYKNDLLLQGANKVDEMDIMKYYAVTHKNHILCNPTSVQKHEELISILKLNKGDTVLEIASGLGEFLVRLNEEYGISGIGIDISKDFLARARKKASERIPNGDVKFIEMDGADYKPERKESFQLAACIGASWIFKGHGGTLDFLIDMVEPGGLIVDGEPFWIKEPSEDYLKFSGMEKDMFSTHRGNVSMAEGKGLKLLYASVSNLDDWDRYEGLQWYSAEEYARSHQDDPDAREILERAERGKEEYLRGGRDTVGWAFYIYRKV